MNFFLKIMLKTLLIIIFVQNYLFAIENVKIILKINNEIITNIDVQKEYNYLIALNNSFKEVNKEKALLIAKESIIKEKIKKNELEKYFDINEESEYLESVIENFYKTLALNNKKEWMTPDLLRRFATNPKLALGLQNPRFVKAMEELQKDLHVDHNPIY